MSLEIKELEKTLGISAHAAELYFAALRYGKGTLTEVARFAKLSRTVTAKPLQELLEIGLLLKQVQGKRIVYHPMNPQELPLVIERKKQRLQELSQALMQQISALEEDLQVRWFSGIAGIQNALSLFYTSAKADNGKVYFFENAETYTYIGKKFADAMVQARIKRNITADVVVITDPETDNWYASHLKKNSEEKRNTIIVSTHEYPFRANIGAGKDTVMIFEYKEKPFALLISNRFVAESIRAIHQMVWDRYHGQV